MPITLPASSSSESSSDITSITLSQVNAKMELAVTALGTNDYATALTAINQAWAYLAVIPDSEVDKSKTAWDRTSIAKLREMVQKETKGATRAARGLSIGGIKFTGPVSE